MGQGSGTGRHRLSRRQRQALDRLEQELVADVDLCRWFNRLANDVPPVALSRPSAGWYGSGMWSGMEGGMWLLP